MRPLPPFNARPIKRSIGAKILARGVPSDTAASVTLADRLGKLKVKPRALLQRPQLKVLGEKNPAC